MTPYCQLTMFKITCQNTACGTSFYFDKEKSPNATKVICPKCKQVQTIHLSMEDFVQSVRQLIMAGKTSETLRFMRDYCLYLDSTFLTNVILLECRFNGLVQDFTIRGIMERTDYDLGIRQINHAILYLLEPLNNNRQPFIKIERDKTKGRLLHTIPPEMALHQSCRIIVRIAFTDEIVKAGLDPSVKYNVEDIRISDLMAVELIDLNDEDTFTIQPITDEKQAVFTEDYTQWLFKVKPLRVGNFALTLKVSVVVVVNGEKVNHNIVLEKSVHILIEQKQEKAVSDLDKVVFVDENKILQLAPLYKTTTTHDTTYMQNEEPPPIVEEEITWRSPYPNKTEIDSSEVNSNIYLGSLGTLTDASKNITFHLSKGINRIGRLTDKGFLSFIKSKFSTVIHFQIDDNTISRHHCDIEVRWHKAKKRNEYILTDKADKNKKASTNGTFINGIRLSPIQDVVLKNGDLIRIGRTELVFQTDK